MELTEDSLIELCAEITNVPSSRLLTLLGQSLLWQQKTGGVQLETGYDLFKGAMPIQTAEDACATNPYVSIKVRQRSLHDD